MSSRRRLLVFLAFAAFLAPACTERGSDGSRATPTPSVSTTLTPTPSPTATPVAAVFDADLTLAHLRRLAVGIGVREAGSAGYRRAADYVADVFDGLGYRVTRQKVPLPSGRSQGVAVRAGSTQNVIARPSSFDPSDPHVVVGAHLDTVARTPGANDNGSGSAMLLELARLASLEPPVMPIVFIAFGGEERRRSGDGGATFGSRTYLRRLGAVERRSLKGVLSIDMVGNGPRAYVCHSALTEATFVDALLDAAKTLKLPAQKRIVAGFFSDHSPFERAGYVVGWLWSGEHNTLHTPRDVFAVVQRASLDRIGRIAWETLRTLKL